MEAQRYLTQMLNDLGTRIDLLRIGGGHWGELTYPSMRYGGHENCYWAFDREAMQTDPAGHWHPAAPSPHDEAHLFIDWYLDRLAEFQNWQIGVVRHSFAKPIIILYPSWGIRPGQLKLAIEGNLSGGTSAEKNGEVPRGFDFARQIRDLADDKVIVSSTWLDADGSADDGTDQTRWSPVHYLAKLVRTTHPSLRLFGENTGRGSPATMGFTAAQAHRFGLCGFAWFSQQELDQPHLATLRDYRNIVFPQNR